LQGVGGTVCLHCPHLHLAEALATELGLTTQRLLGTHGARTGGTGVNRLVDQVVQLQHVHVAHGARVLVWLTSTADDQLRLTEVNRIANTVAGGQARTHPATQRADARTTELWRSSQTIRGIAPAITPQQIQQPAALPDNDAALDLPLGACLTGPIPCESHPSA